MAMTQQEIIDQLGRFVEDPEDLEVLAALADASPHSYSYPIEPEGLHISFCRKGRVLMVIIDPNGITPMGTIHRQKNYNVYPNLQKAMEWYLNDIIRKDQGEKVQSRS